MSRKGDHRGIDGLFKNYIKSPLSSRTSGTRTNRIVHSNRFASFLIGSHIKVCVMKMMCEDCFSELAQEDNFRGPLWVLRMPVRARASFWRFSIVVLCTGEMQVRYVWCASLIDVGWMVAVSMQSLDAGFRCVQSMSMNVHVAVCRFKFRGRSRDGGSSGPNFR